MRAGEGCPPSSPAARQTAGGPGQRGDGEEDILRAAGGPSPSQAAHQTAGGRGQRGEGLPLSHVGRVLDVTAG